jgi:leader peptidase (prepilin peptidase)/N-methyltransferase
VNAAGLPVVSLVGMWAVLGLLVGSFLNVVIHRVPAGLSLVSPGSACPACGHAVRPYDNVPVLSWLLLRGRCRDCRHPISSRYPAVELVTAALFAATAWRFGWAVFTVAATVLVAAGIALFMIDLDHRRLPFSITRVAAAGVVVALAVEGLVEGWSPLPAAVLSAVLWVGVYGGVWLLTAGRGMGLGDVALAPVLGLVLGWLGWGPSLVGLLGGFVVGAVVGAVLMVLGRAGRRSKVPHGPFLLTGAAVGMFAGQPLWEAYLGLFGLR